MEWACCSLDFNFGLLWCLFWFYTDQSNKHVGQMKKEIFKHEIIILKNTFLRLLRRHAEINLIKLIKKTHPADLAIVFRYFDEDQQH